MKICRLLSSAAAILVVVLVVYAQSQLSAWPFFVEVTSTDSPGVYSLIVPLQVMGEARDDLADLRLFDAENQEIPYAIRVRTSVNEQREFGATVFNEVTIGSSATEATIDLGDNPGEHNEVQVQTAGSNFRRLVVIEGSNSSTGWRTLKSDGVVFGFQSDGKMVESNRVAYPTSRYRYLRIRVNEDELSDDGPPDITSLRVMMGIHEQGALTTWDVPVPSYQLIRNQGAHAASWIIDLGARVPCDRLSLTINDSSFYRPFEVETFDDPQNPRLVANGYLSRRAGEDQKPEVITFDQEEHVRKLRLQITDYSNPTLSINTIEAGAPARELVFELRQPQTAPLRLFFGNSKIAAPHYDFEKELTPKLRTPPAQSTVGFVTKNESYVPEPLPFTERVPWLIYLVLAGSSVALGWILFSLARSALRLTEQKT